MYSNMCVKLALCLALVVCIDGHVLKHRTLPLSAEGMIVEITVRSKEDPRHPLQTTRVDINEKDKTVVIATAELLPGASKQSQKVALPVPTLQDRNGIRVGACPVGTESQAGFCFPTDDA